MEQTKWYLVRGYSQNPKHCAMIARFKDEAKSLDEAGIRQLVESLLTTRGESDAYWMLAVLDERAVPSLVAAFADPRLLAPGVLSDDGPFELVWKLLEPLAPVEAVPNLTALLDHASRSVQAQAAVCLGSIAKPACEAGLRRVFQSEDHHIRSMGLAGLNRAIWKRRADAALLSALFEDVARIVDRPSVGGTDAPAILLAIDRDRAVQHLLAPERFRIEHSEISSIVSALAEKRIAVSGDQIAVLLDSVASSSKPGSITPIGYGLQLLAITGHPSAEQRIEQSMASSDSFLRDLASDAFLILNGIPEAYQVAIGAWGRSSDVTQFPEPIRNYATVHVLHNEVGNGSFDQYFFNSYGEDVHHALAGLEAIGAKDSARIVRKVIKLFGQPGPSRDRAERQQQLDRVDGAALVTLSDELLKDRDRLKVLLARYAVQHKEFFVRN